MSNYSLVILQLAYFAEALEVAQAAADGQKQVAPKPPHSWT